LTKQTTSLSLSKPEITDKIVDTITQLASNFDVIDLSLVEKAKQADLDTANASIAVKADKTYVDSEIAKKASGAPKGVYATLSALQTALPTGSSDNQLVTADGKWYYWSGAAWTAGAVYQSTGIGKNSVTPDNTTFLTPSQNLFNKNTVTTKGQYINGATGVVYTNSPYSDPYYVSDWIMISPNTTYTKVELNYYSFYDINKVFISGVNGASSQTFTTPVNAAYMRYSTKNPETEMLVVGSSLPITYVAFGYTFAVNNASISFPSYDNAINTLNAQKTAKLKMGKNLFNKNTITAKGIYINGTNGNAITNSPYSDPYYVSDWIAVKPNTTYTKNEPSYYAFYDANKVYISGVNGGTSGTFITPANTSYMKMSTKSPDSEMLVEGSVLPINYVAYSFEIYSDDGNPVTIPSYDSAISTLNSQKTAKLRIGKNLFNKATVTAGQYVFGGSDGHVGVNSPFSDTYFASDWIPVKPNTSYTKKDANGYYAVYDANKVRIAGENGSTVTTFTTGANAAYVRISTKDIEGEIFVEGTSLPGYIPYGYEIYSDDNLPVISSNQTTSVVSKWSNKNVLAIGDSLTAVLKWQNTVASMHGCNITTHALGGIGFTTMVDGGAGSGGTISALTVSDVTGKDLIILFGGMNERSTPYGQLGDLHPTQSTIFGRLQYVINTIYSLLKSANNLTCKIMIVAPHCCGKYGYNDVDGYGEFPVGTGQTLENLVNNMKKCSNYNNIRIVDLWHNSGVGKNTWSVYMASSTAVATTPDNTLPFPNNGDQVHFNDMGYTRIGEVIAAEMNMI
jgi:lysophospholipase L1-like esterase